LFAATFLTALPVLAQTPAGDQPKFPTPPPLVDAQTSVINPPYADAVEYKIDPAVPQGEVREFIM
jgi:hypothetical protein